MIHLLRLVQLIYFYTIRKCVCTNVLKPVTKHKTTIVEPSFNWVGLGRGSERFTVMSELEGSDRVINIFEVIFHHELMS